MTESISHKKGIKITSNITNNRRQALKEFYKLRESQQQKLEQIASETAQQETAKPEPVQVDMDNTTKEATDVAEPTMDNFEQFVRQNEFSTLLRIENKICEELNSNQSEIKSIIYNNYYELIKINDVLMNLKERNEAADDDDDTDVISNLNKIRSHVVELNRMDMTVLPSGIRKDHTLQKSIGEVLTAPRIPRDSLTTIEEILPTLKGESLILQMNELKRKALN